MEMDMKLLEAFKTVVESRSVTQAASIMGVTQPAVSAQLGRLEEMLGFQLFDRLGGRLAPTKEGLSFYQEVAKVVADLAHLRQFAENIRKGSLGRLVIASHPSAGISLLPPLVADFLKAHPEVSVQLITRNSDMVRGLFPSQHCDIGIAEMPIDYRGIQTTRYRTHCVAVLPKGHPLAAESVITPALLSGVPFFAVSSERSTYHALFNAFAEAGAEFNLVGEAELFASVCGVVEATGAVSVVDPWSAESYGAGLVVRPFEPMIPYDIGVFHAADRRPSTIAAEFLDRLDRRLRELGATARRVRSAS
jgi:DNA-binding transcriptional LysR family regulator